MSKRFSGPRAHVLAAVKVDAKQHPGLDAAVSLCQRTGMALRLISVIETNQYSGLYVSPYDVFDLSTLDVTLGEEKRQDVETALSAIAAKLKLESPVSTVVVVGTPAQAIMAEAVVSKSALIVTGAEAGSHRFVPKGMSTALSLMANASTPVMVVSASSKIDFKQEALKIFVADDLTTSSERAIFAAIDLALALRHTDIHHVHASPMNMDIASRFFNQASATRKGDAGDANEGQSLADVWDAVVASLKKKLEARAPNAKALLEKVGGHYWLDIRSGGVETQLEAAITSADPDILFFGRHSPMHIRPFGIGKIPFHHMLSQNKVLVVIPPLEA